MSLAIRISKPYDEVFDWVDNIEADKVLVYEHPADEEISRTHIHLLVVASKCKPDALKARYKKLYGDIDKSDWSFKSADVEYERYITYMSKGHLAPKLSKGFELSDITKLTEAWVDPKTIEVKLQNGKLVKQVNESPTISKRVLLEQMRSRMSSGDSTREILKHIRKVLIDNNQVIGQYKMMDYYDSLIMYDRKEEWLCMMERRIKSKYDI